MTATDLITEYFDDQIERLETLIDRIETMGNVATTDYSQEIPNYGHVITVRDFKRCVANGSFIDYDGFGHPVKEINGVLKASGIRINPSTAHNDIPRDAEYIVWFNR